MRTLSRRKIGSGHGSWNAQEGDREVPSYDKRLLGLVIGYGYVFNEDVFAGIARGRAGAEMDFSRWGRRGAWVDYDGWQIGHYGGFDNSVLYTRGILAYGWNDGDSKWQIVNDSIVVSLTGSPDSHVLSFYGETV